MDCAATTPQAAPSKGARPLVLSTMFPHGDMDVDKTGKTLQLLRQDGICFVSTIEPAAFIYETIEEVESVE
uniref:MGS-like domain-containing protein n=1 Tax=Panagrellus redivivus TaxID=6233 RepID=A0A7E4VR80_PANRE